MLSDLWLDSVGKIDFERIFHKYVGDLSKGILEPMEVISKMEEETNIQFPKDYNLIQDFVMRFEGNKGLEILLKELKKEYKIWLLTNMYTWMFWTIQKKGILPDIKWDIVIDSSIIGMRKPDEDIYIYAENAIWAKWDSILFVDNLEENIISAKKLGWNTLLYNPRDKTTSNKAILDFLQDIH